MSKQVRSGLVPDRHGNTDQQTRVYAGQVGSIHSGKEYLKTDRGVCKVRTAITILDIFQEFQPYISLVVNTWQLHRSIYILFGTR